MSHELTDFKNIVRILVSFDPFPRRCFAECNHALAQTCGLSLMLTRVFFFSLSSNCLEATVHFYEFIKRKRISDATHLNDLKKFRRVTLSCGEDTI